MTEPFATHEEQRRLVLATLLMEVSFEGWTEAALDMALTESGVEAGKAVLFPQVIRDALDFWASEEDRAMAEAYEALEVKPGKIRDKVTWLVRRRIEQMTPNREAARRAAAVLALPLHHGLGAQMTWRTAGAMWRALGDQSTDGNYYTKRATLSAVYTTTLMRWFADEADETTEPYPATWAFLEQRIDNVMQFEKLKAKAKKFPLSPERVAETLARLRYAGSG